MSPSADPRESKTTWITGATGYLGGAFLKSVPPELQGDQLVLLSRSKNPSLAGPGRIVASPSELAQLRAQHPPRRIIHFATEFRNAYQPAEAESMLAANVGFPVAMLEACRGIPRLEFLNFGTFYSHASGGDSPFSFYAATKSAFESFLSYYAPAHGWSAITLKIFDTYGPADPRPKLVPKLLEVLRTQAPFPLSQGQQKLSLVHVDDITRAARVALRSFRSGEHLSFQLPASTTGLPTLREVVATFEKAAGRTIAAQWGAVPYRDREIMEPKLDCPVLPGWKAEIPLADGFKQVLGSG